MIGLSIAMRPMKIKRNLTELRTALSDLKPEMDIVQREVRQAMIEHFEGFNRFIGTQNKEYRKSKPVDRVGVYTGDLCAAFKGGPGGIDKMESYYGVANAKYTWGLRPGSFQGRDKRGRFTKGYIKYFDGWLQQRGERLVELDEEKQAEIMDKFIAALRLRISRYM